MVQADIHKSCRVFFSLAGRTRTTPEEESKDSQRWIDPFQTLWGESLGRKGFLIRWAGASPGDASARASTFARRTTRSSGSQGSPGRTTRGSLRRSWIESRG